MQSLGKSELRAPTVDAKMMLVCLYLLFLSRSDSGRHAVRLRGTFFEQVLRHALDITVRCCVKMRVNKNYRAVCHTAMFINFAYSTKYYEVSTNYSANSQNI